MAISPWAYAPQTALGAVQAVSALKGLNDLKKQALPEYDMTQAQKNVSMYQKRFDQGLSPEERAAMGQQFSSATAGFYRAASEQSKGSLSNFLGRISALDRIKYATQMGTMMAQEKRAAMGGLAGARNTLMGQQNRQTAYEMQRRDAAERALGQALQSGLYNATTGLTYGIASFDQVKKEKEAAKAAAGGFNPVGAPGSYPFSSMSMRPSVTVPMSYPDPTFSAPPVDPYGLEPGYGNYPKNLLRFSNPYNMNRGFMNDYEAVAGPYGEVNYIPFRQ